jgi:AraC-like DNA-binding protein
MINAAKFLHDPSNQSRVRFSVAPLWLKWAMQDMRPLNELRRLIARHGSPGRVRPPSLPGLTLMTATEPTVIVAEVVEPRCVVLAQGLEHFGVGKTTFTYRAGQFLVISVDLPLQAHVIEATKEVPCLGLSFILKPEAIASLLLEGDAARPRRTDPPGIAISPLTPELLDPFVRLLRLLDRPGDIPVLSAAIEREILWRLINGLQGPTVQQIGLADSRMAQIGRATRWARRHYARKFRIEELAEIAGMSVTSFHRHFRRVTSLTPIQYQRQLRLQAARSRLMSGARNIAEVGFAVGYDSPSQFSREYRRQFGRPPGADGVSLRSK